MKLPTLSDGTWRELIYPGACLSREQARPFWNVNVYKRIETMANARMETKKTGSHKVQYTWHA